MLTSFVSAGSNIFNFKVYEPAEIDFSMLNNNFSTCVECSCVVSIFHPNGSAWVRDTPGTATSGICTYTFTPTKVGVYGGEYRFNNTADYGGGDFEITVTTTGVEQSSILENPFLLFSVLLGIIFLSLGVWLGVPTLGFLSSILFILSGMYGLIYGFNNFTDVYSRGLGGVLIGIGFIIMMFAAYEWISETGE